MKQMIARSIGLCLVLFVLASCSTTNSGPLPNPGTDQTEPVITSVTGVAEDDTVSGDVAITINATDNVAVTRITLFVNGVEEAFAANSTTLSATLDTTELDNGPHVLLIVARDAVGNDAERTIHITVDNNAGAPQITSVTGVEEGETISGTVAITVNATDDVAVTGITMTVDGNAEASSSSGTLDHSLDTTDFPDGAHALRFVATDADSNTDELTINVTIDNSPAPTGATVSGVVFAPNGTDPLSGALVYVENDPPTDPHLAEDLSDAAGAFLLEDVPTGAQTFVIEKGAFKKVFIFNVAEGTNELTTEQTTLPASGTTVGKILVVTGQYDVIENVLAKLGLGDVDLDGQLVIGTEEFDMVDGDNSLDDGTYQNFDEFFATETNFDQYRTIFLNCGNDYETEFFADTDAVNALRAWVEAGGRLYVTDWSYNFAEQLWPERVDFASFTAGDGFSSTPEGVGEALTGSSMTSLTCEILDASLSAWMDSLSATNGANTFETVDWLPAWAVIEDVDANVKVWAEGNVTYSAGLGPEVTAVRPVTISFEEGTGVVLFSSYHTEETPNTALTPQERVLQYLIFEIL